MPIIGYSQEEKQKDIKKMKKFIENNPYPKYESVMNIIEKDKDYFNMFSEYGTPNHEWMKKK